MSDSDLREVTEKVGKWYVLVLNAGFLAKKEKAAQIEQNTLMLTSNILGWLHGQV